MLATTKIWTVGLFFLSFFYFTNIHGQGKYGIIDSRNFTSVTNQIHTDLGTMIDIPISQTQGFLGSLVTLSDPNYIDAPDAEVLYSGAGTIELKWDPVPTADCYTYGYINLKTGAQVSLSSTGSHNNIYTINNVPNDLFLLFVKTKKGGIESGVDIIIEDKVVFKVVFTDRLGCDCPYYTNTQVLNNSWPSILPDKKFQLRIKDLISGHDLGVITGIKQGNEIKFNLNCSASSFEIYEYNHILYFYNNGQYIGAFTFSPESYFPAGHYQILFSYCSNTNPSSAYPVSRSSNHKFKAGSISNDAAVTAFPNPFRDKLTVEIPETDSEQITIQLFSVGGKIMKEFKTNNQGHKKEMNTTGLKKGFYYCLITAGNEVKQIPLVRL